MKKLTSCVLLLLALIATGISNIPQIRPQPVKTANTESLVNRRNQSTPSAIQEEQQQEEVIIPDNTIPTDSINIDLNEYGLELPINGATGFTSIAMPLYENSNKDSVLTTLEPGTAFIIIEETNDLWLVDVNGMQGYLEHLYAMINLPDVIPSIIYNNSNSYCSLYRSVGNPLDGVTDHALYYAIDYSERFSENQYIMPVLYSMSKKIASAQNEALKNGNSLKIYETFRPYDTQRKVSDALSVLMESNNEVYQMTNSSPWSKTWFISTKISNHQKGYAMDVSLANVTSAEKRNCGNYTYVKVTSSEEYQMPTTIHELSSLSATFTYPVSSSSKTEWKNAQLSPSMNTPAILLQSYCTNSGLTPLASEWWHFNDLDTKEAIGENYGNGKFFVTENLSRIPE